MLLNDFENADDDELMNYLLWMDSFRPNRRKYLEALGASPSSRILSIEKAPILEEKPLLAHLYHAYLGNSSKFSVIIPFSFSTSEEEKLLRVLHDHKNAIGWSIANIKGTQPSMCTHRILMEESSKPNVEAQRRLNLTMNEVVRSKVLK